MFLCTPAELFEIGILNSIPFTITLKKPKVCLIKYVKDILPKVFSVEE